MRLLHAVLPAALAGAIALAPFTGAHAADKNKDGIYNDAPAVVPDSNHDGRINAVDLEAFGIASNIAVVRFEIRD